MGGRLISFSFLLALIFLRLAFFVLADCFAKEKPAKKN